MATKWNRDLSLKILTFVIVAGITVAVLEFGLRNFSGKPPSYISFKDSFGNYPKGIVVPHPTRGYAYRPNFRGTARRQGRTLTVRINASGFRDRPIEIKTGELRVIAVGDSFTAGWGVESQNAWPQQLQKFISQREGLRWPIRVVNAGVSGYSLK